MLVRALEKNSETSRDDIRVFLARMGHGGVNKLIGGTRPFPWHHIYPRDYLSGDLAEKQQVRKLPVEMSWR